MKTDLILIKNSLIEIPDGNGGNVSKSLHGTLFANLAYYGYALSAEATKALFKLNDDELKAWWSKIEPILKEITGANRNMSKFVVYKNFPNEVLSKTESEYWFAQILMYIGFPSDLFTDTEIKRDKMLETLSPAILHLAKNNSLENVYNGLLHSPVRWTKEQFGFARYFVIHGGFELDTKSIVFKENLVSIVAEAMTDTLIKVKLSSATDVLRLGVALSDGDVTFEKNTKFRNFSRKERRFLLNLLEKSSNLEEDVARDRERWLKFLRNLHPGDYPAKYKNVAAVQNKLYQNTAESFNSKVEKALDSLDEKALALLESRPGDFVRRFHYLISIYGNDAVKSFQKIAPKLKVIQLLKIQKYFETINTRKQLTVAPKGNWSKLQILENKKFFVPISLLDIIDSTISKELSRKLNKGFRGGVNLDPSAKEVVLQTSDAELSPYGRGTVFHIPDDVNFLRTASYWQNGGSVTWFDNGWNFFDANWKEMGACCWTNVNFANKGAVFSGDPVNSSNKEGKACQMIDLYIDKLIASGVRYAVWNILCFSKVKFSEAKDVFATLQWGEDAKKGELFEPSRCKLAFPLKGDAFTKYVAYIDLVERKIVYMDANFKCSTSSAAQNSAKLAEVMPAFNEYIKTLPTVFDLFDNAKRSKTGTTVIYSDKSFAIKSKKAYVFRPENEKNKYEKLEIAGLLNL